MNLPDVDNPGEYFEDDTPETKTEVKLEVKTESTKQEVARGMDLNEQGLVMPKSSTDLWQMSSAFLKSRALPKSFENAAQVFMAMQFLNEQKIPFGAGIRQVAIINGTLSIWGELPKAVCARSGLMLSIDEKLFDKDYIEISYANKNLHVEPWGAVCIVSRKGGDAPVSRSFTLDEAKTAQLLGKDTWKKYPKRMLQMRARSHALKDAFPDVLSGIAISEYDFHRVMDDAPPEVKSVAQELNEKYLTQEDASPKQEIAG